MCRSFSDAKDNGTVYVRRWINDAQRKYFHGLARSVQKMVNEGRYASLDEEGD